MQLTRQQFYRITHNASFGITGKLQVNFAQIWLNFPDVLVAETQEYDFLEFCYRQDERFELHSDLRIYLTDFSEVILYREFEAEYFDHPFMPYTVLNLPV